MANRYKKNITTFWKMNKFSEEVREYLKSYEITDGECQLVDGIPCFYQDGYYYRMRSEQPLEEAKRMTRELDPMKDHLIVVFGMGNVALLRKLMQDTTSGTRILVIENNAYIMNYIFAHENLDDIIARNKIVITCAEEKILEHVIYACMGSNWENLVHNLQILSMPYYALYEDFQIDTVKMISKAILYEINSLGNSLPDVMNGLRNNYTSVDGCTFCNSISELRGKFKGVPAIIVSGGPSLDKNVELLKQAEGKAVILSTDAAYRACRRIGVKADAIASIERDEPTYKHFYENQEMDPDMVLIGPSLMWPDIIGTYPGKKVLMKKTQGGADGWWGNFFPSIEWLNMGFSCANVAHAVASEMGCEPIILIGQDFAYTNNKKHSEDAKYHKENVVKEKKQGDKDAVWVEDINGEMVQTTEYLNMFRQGMEARILVDQNLVIDATEGGAKIKGTKIMTFADAIAQYCTEEKTHSMSECLEDIVFDKETARKKYQEIIEAAEEMLKDLQDIKDRIQKHCDIINKYESVDFENLPMDDLVDIVVNMQAGNDIIDFMIKEKRNLITFYQQNLKQTIIYVKKIGNDVTGETVKRNWELQEHLMYLMEVTTIVVTKQYKELIAFMEDKLEKLEAEV